MDIHDSLLSMSANCCQLPTAAAAIAVDLCCCCFCQVEGMMDATCCWLTSAAAAAAAGMLFCCQVEGMMDATYDSFLSEVAAGRGMSKEAVRQLAKGRVWSGAQAVEVSAAAT
jgi:hypothetical protein